MLVFIGNENNVYVLINSKDKINTINGWWDELRVKLELKWAEGRHTQPQTIILVQCALVGRKLYLEAVLEWSISLPLQWLSVRGARLRWALSLEET